MTAVSDLDPNAPAERLPGDFKRNAHTKAPYVSDPTGATVKSGERRGLPKWVMYGRPSGFGDQIENGTNLEKYNQRLIILGLALKQNLLVEAIRFLSDGNGDEKEWRKIADKCVNDARDAADADLAADRGTFAHALTHDADMGIEDTTVEEGEALGIPAAAQGALVLAWNDMRSTYRLEVLASEVTVVNDRYRQAGTLDRIVRLGRDLTFTVEGELVTLPAGAVLVLDIKTGADHKDAGYWNSYAVQIAAYASSLPYDTETETRGEWAWEINERWALIAHLPVAAAIEGEATCTVVLVDLQRGHHAAALCMAAKAWEASRDVFGTLHEIAVEPASLVAPVTVGGGETHSPAADKDPFAGLTVTETHGIAQRPVEDTSGIDLRHYTWTATMPDETELVEDPDRLRGLLAEAYEARPANQQAIIDSIIRSSDDAKVGIGDLGRHPTVRRFEAARAVFAIAKHMWAETEPTARAAIRLVMGDKPEVEQAPLGALIGSMTVAELRQLVLVIEDYGDGKFVEDWSSLPEVRLSRAA